MNRKKLLSWLLILTVLIASYNMAFSVAADPTPAAPAILSMNATEVTADGYKVTITFTAPGGVSRIEMPTWTNANSQDDLIWHRATYTGNTASFYVKTSDHKGESGIYTTHAYVYDRYGNFGIYGINVNVPAHPVSSLSIIHAQVSDVSSEGYRVTVQASSSAFSKVLVPTWTDANGQDDLIWHEATKNGATASCYVKKSNHKGESGAYTTHVYVYDTHGHALAPIGLSAVLPSPQPAPAVPVITDLTVSKVDKTGYTVNVQYQAAAGVARVEMPTWTDANGQDDLVWHNASFAADHASLHIPVSEHNNESGTYTTHIYVHDRNGNSTIKGISVTVPGGSQSLPPTITDASISNIDASGYTVTVHYTAPAGVDRVLMPTWTEAGGQDDLIWHEAPVGTGSTSLRISTSQHKKESGSYLTHIYVYDKQGNYALKDLYATVSKDAVSNPGPWQGDFYSLPNNTFYGPMSPTAAGALALENQYRKYNCEIVGDTSRKVMYLTFGCGWENNGLTNTVLDILKARNIKAVFFITGSYLKKNPVIVDRMIKEGHIVGSHSWGHINYPTLSVTQQQQDLRTMHEEMLNRHGYTIKYFNFPSGCGSERSLAVVGNFGYKTLGFTGCYADYDVNNQKPANVVLDILNKAAFPGAVYFLHPVSPTNAVVLGPWIDSMIEQGYSFELFEG